MTELEPLVRHLYGPLDDTDAPVMVLCHGITDNADCWAESLDRWAGLGYRLVALDARGHGHSLRWTAADLASADVAGARLAQDLEDVLEDILAHGVQGEGPLQAPIVLTGHSMGGITALDVAARRPELVQAVLAEDPAFLTPIWAQIIRLNAPRSVREAQAIVADPSAQLERELAEHPTWSRRATSASITGYTQVDQNFLAVGCVAPPTTWEEIVDGLKVPVLIVTGTERVVVRQENLVKINERANSLISTAVLPGAGHCVRRTFPERFHSVADPFLARALAA